MAFCEERLLCRCIQRCCSRVGGPESLGWPYSGTGGFSRLDVDSRSTVVWVGRIVEDPTALRKGRITASVRILEL